jgi:KDO2-lipid IV(A) lauroyltransferase
MKSLRYRIEYWLALLGAKLARALSLEAAQALARGLGRGAYRLGVAREATLDNLSLTLPELSLRQRKAIALQAYEGFAQTMIETTRMPSTSPQEIAGYFEFVNLDYLEQVKAAGLGAICMSAHYGNWEWMGAALIQKGFPMTFMIGTQSNPHVDRIFNEYRSKVGIKFVRIRSIKEVVRGLKNGEFMALLGDQDGDKLGMFVDFFGQSVSTHIIGDILARKTGAATFFGVPERLGPRRHRVEIVELPQAPEHLSENLATAFRLQAYNNALEQAIRRDPGQWLWMHRRFQSKPFHHLQGDERRMAEEGVAVFDALRQTWVWAKDGTLCDFKTWQR